ncbi:MAG: tetratricopeptide repeat protein [Bacteroidota bacterium]|nr:tetratricopeptide repeat protein [Bacteroidota bacterium]
MMHFIQLYILIVVLFVSPFHANYIKRLLFEGNKAIVSKDYALALEYYEEVLKQEPDNFLAQYNKGSIFYTTNKYWQAAEAWAKASYTAPDAAQKSIVFYNLGNTYLQRENWTKSIQHYSSALKQNPDNVYAKYNLSYALLKKKQDEQTNPQPNSGGKDGDKEQPKDDKADKGANNDKGDQGDKPQPEQQLGADEAEQMLDALQQQEDEIRRRLYRMNQKDPNLKKESETPW